MTNTSINDLSPSESLVILYPVNASYKALIRYSIIELLHLKVLSVSKEDARVKGAAKVKYFFIRRGENFGELELKPHLKLFTIPFIDREKKFPLHLFIHRALEMSDVDMFSFKYHCLYKPLVSKGYFTDTIFRKLYLYFYTSRGSACRRELDTFIRKGEANLKNWIENDHERLLKLIETLGLNILLLENINGKLLEAITAALGTNQDLHESSWNYVDIPYFDSHHIDIPDSQFDFGGGEFGGGGASGDWGDFDFDTSD